MLIAEHDNEYIFFKEDNEIKYIAKYSEDVSHSLETEHYLFLEKTNKIDKTCIAINSIINPFFPRISNFLYYLNLASNPQYTIVEDKLNTKMVFTKTSVLSKEIRISISIPKF